MLRSRVLQELDVVLRLRSDNKNVVPLYDLLEAQAWDYNCHGHQRAPKEPRCALSAK
jgi:hypothetical protein